MRTDVKIGIVLSLVIVVIAGWYYLRRGSQEEAIPLAVELASQSNQAAATGDEAARPDSPAQTAPRQARRSPARPADRSKATAPAARPPNPADQIVALNSDSADENSLGPLSDVIPRGRNTSGLSATTEVEGPALTATSPETPPARPNAAASGEPALPRGDPGTGNASARPGASAASPAEASRTTTSDRRPPAGSRTHVVERGDTLCLLAEVYYGSQRYAKALADANPQLTNPDRLLIGTKLVIPPQERLAGGAVAAAPESRPRTVPPGSYRVQEGDSFYAIARDVLGDAGRWQELLALNEDLVDGDPQNLQAGQVLKLPAGTGSSDP